MGWASNIFPLLIITASGGFTGLFVYSPAPGHGNLIYSVTGQSGTDPFGNSYTNIATAYGPIPTGGTGPATIREWFSGKLFLSFGTGAASEVTAGNISADLLNPGAANETLELFVGGGNSSASDDGVFINCSSSPANAANSAKGFLSYQVAGGADISLFSWAAVDGVFRNSVAGLSGGVPLLSTDTFPRTVTATGNNQITFGYAIPGATAAAPNGDPLILANHQNTIYRIHAWGHGTQANPVTSLGILTTAFNINWITPDTIANTLAGAGHAFSWEYEAWVQVTAAGGLGTATGQGFARWISTDNVTGASLVSVLENQPQGGFSTLTAWTMQVNIGWTVAGNGATITCDGSRFVREGA